MYQVEPVTPQPQPGFTTISESFFTLDAEDEKKMEETAIRWGVDALKAYNGTKLRRALDISRAIVDFLDEGKSC